MRAHINPLLVAIAISFSVGACGRAGFNVPTSGKALLPSETMSKIEISKDNIADGITPAIVTITVHNSKGTPIEGVVMTLWVSGSDNVIIPCGTSDAQGVSRCKIYSTKAEHKMVRAMGTTSSVVLALETDFKSPRPTMSSFAIVSAASIDNDTFTNRMITTLGMNESDAAQYDSNGVLRVHSTIQGAVLND